MRYAIVIEKAPANYAAYVPICRVALPPAPPWQKPNPSSEKPSSFISKVSSQMAFLSLHPAAKSNTSTSPLKVTPSKLARYPSTPSGEMGFTAA